MIYNNIVKAKQLVDLLNDSETFFQNKDYPANNKQCELCGKPVHSNSKVQTVCDKCASEYKF